MNREEARAIQSRKLDELRKQSYADLCRFLKEENIESVDVIGDSGVRYSLEVFAVWDDRPHKNLRVFVCIDDGGWSSLKPLTDDFIIAPDGTFVGE